MIAIPKSFVKSVVQKVPLVGPVAVGVGIALDIKEVAENSTPMAVSAAASAVRSVIRG